jgi:hypothetical protein
VFIAAGVSEINQENITNMVGSQECPFATGVLQSVTLANSCDIGDTITTVKNYINDDFLLCNNALFSKNEYPNLFNAASTLDSFWGYFEAISSDMSAFNGMVEKRWDHCYFRKGRSSRLSGLVFDRRGVPGPNKLLVPLPTMR